MVYSKAIEFRSTSPCTNVPLNCPLCPAGSKQQTFWKYNFFQHMLEFHLENGNLPPCPPQLTVETHITKEEEALMDIGTEKTTRTTRNCISWRYYEQ
jgi:hypothetical protein